MTDRIAGFIVTLDRDIRDDDVESIKTALRMVKSVISVEPVVSGIDLHLATMRVRSEYQAKIYKALEDVF